MKISQTSRILNSQNRTTTAFSLIELSIVILIIGVLVTAVTSSSALLGRASLTAARKYTADSSVRYSSGLVAWYDPTTELAFGSTTSTLADGAQLSTTVLFDDVYTSSFDASVATASAAVTYVKSGINGLPAVGFNSTGGVAANGLSTVATFPPVASSEATIFVVSIWKPLSNAVLLEKGGNDFSIKQNSATAGNLDITFGGTNVAVASSPTAGVSFANGNPNVMSFVYSKADAKVYVYRNGVAFNDATGTALVAASTPSVGTLTIGSSNNASAMSNGSDVGEVIIFNRKLSDAERKEIETYLGAKWKIKVS